MPTKLEIPTTRYDNNNGVVTTHSGGVVETMVPKKNKGRPLGSMDTRPRKKVSLAQPYPFIINTGNPFHEIISDYSYVYESILGNVSMIEQILDNREISMNYACMLEKLEKIPLSLMMYLHILLLKGL